MARPSSVRRNPADAVDEQLALAVLADGVAGIDAAGNAKVDRIAPRPFDPSARRSHS